MPPPHCGVIGKLLLCDTSCIWNKAVLLPLLFCWCRLLLLQKKKKKKQEPNIFGSFQSGKTKREIVFQLVVWFLSPPPENSDTNNICYSDTRQRWHHWAPGPQWSPVLCLNVHIWNKSCRVRAVLSCVSTLERRLTSAAATRHYIFSKL